MSHRNVTEQANGNGLAPLIAPSVLESNCNTFQLLTSFLDQGKTPKLAATNSSVYIYKLTSPPYSQLSFYQKMANLKVADGGYQLTKWMGYFGGAQQIGLKQIVFGNILKSVKMEEVRQYSKRQEHQPILVGPQHSKQSLQFQNINSEREALFRKVQKLKKVFQNNRKLMNTQINEIQKQNTLKRGCQIQKIVKDKVLQVQKGMQHQKIMQHQDLQQNRQWRELTEQHKLTGHENEILFLKLQCLTPKDIPFNLLDIKLGCKPEKRKEHNRKYQKSMTPQWNIRMHCVWLGCYSSSIGSQSESKQSTIKTDHSDNKNNQNQKKTFKKADLRQFGPQKAVNILKRFFNLYKQSNTDNVNSLLENQFALVESIIGNLKDLYLSALKAYEMGQICLVATSLLIVVWKQPSDSNLNCQQDLYYHQNTANQRLLNNNYKNQNQTLKFSKLIRLNGYNYHLKIIDFDKSQANKTAKPYEWIEPTYSMSDSQPSFQSLTNPSKQECNNNNNDNNNVESYQLSSPLERKPIQMYSNRVDIPHNNSFYGYSTLKGIISLIKILSSMLMHAKQHK